VSRRRFLAEAAALGLALACRAQPPGRDGETPRIVSLAPAVTETLFAIGAGKQLVGVSDYCETPAEARSRPRLGTSITPNYEAIAGLRPTLIVSEKNAASRRRELEALAKTELLPWLTLPEIETGIRRLGQLTGHEARARELSAELVRRLDVREPQRGPRVLLVLGEAGDEIWFIRRNSLHGSVLHAAGARNAVAEDVLGPPNLSAERLLELDPDAIVVLVRPDPGRPKQRAIGRFQRFSTLRAVRSGRVGSVEDEAAFSHGPSIVGLVDRVHGELVRIGALE
jgi:ABC-type Fe3+-hydroxamate transport system substrate-binding protein